jgi:hypothetical protein
MLAEQVDYVIGVDTHRGQLGELCYFEMPELGALLELLYVTELPPPEKTIG